MREILFRGKRKDNGEWVYGFLTKMWGVLHIIDKDNENIAYEIIPDTLGQFTGLTDKNDKKMFEGDIVEVTYDDGTAYITAVCAYGNTLCVDVEGEDYDFTAIDFAIDDWNDNCCEFEIIGNICDNPELLGEN